MRRLAPSALTIALALAALLPPPAATQSGAAPRLRIDMALRNDASELQIKWINDGSSGFLLDLGGLVGAEPLYGFRLLVAAHGRKPELVGVVEGSGTIEGRPDPWVTFLPPQSEFALSFGTNKLAIPREGVMIRDLKGPWTLTLTYSGEPATDYAPGGHKIPYSITRNGPTRIPFWVGTITQHVSHP